MQPTGPDLDEIINLFFFLDFSIILTYKIQFQLFEYIKSN